MSKIIGLGIDPGLRRTGYALAQVNSGTGRILDVLDVGVIETDRTKHRTVRKTSDDLRRAKEQCAGLREILESTRVDFIAAEIVTTTPYTLATFSFGVMIGILASFNQPIIQVLPRELKLASVGNDRASKRDIIEWALEVPTSSPLEWPTSGRTNSLQLIYAGAYLAKSAEHPADALATIQAAVATEQFRLARGLFMRKVPVRPRRLDRSAC